MAERCEENVLVDPTLVVLKFGAFVEMRPLVWIVSSILKSHASSRFEGENRLHINI